MLLRSRHAIALALTATVLAPAASFTSLRAAGPPVAAGTEQAPAGSPNELDAFMARVLERRDETWRTLHDYVLDETEQFQIVGPGGTPLHGMKREFTWYVRDGFLVRSPLRYDGVRLSEDERRRYEHRWLEQEKSREQKAAKAEAEKRKAAMSSSAQAPDAANAAETRPAEGDPSLQDFVGQRGEPRFVSEAYFLRFKFEPGNYYFAGRETLDGRPVVRIEYYPTRLFDDEHEKSRERSGDAADKAGHGRSRKERERDKAKEQEYTRKFNKVALVTLWIDPAEYQIVRYTFDNMDFGFLPGRWLVRLDEARASMVMARVLDGVWLPREITVRAGMSLANGSYAFDYARRFSGYKKAETGARIRSIVPR